MIASKDALAAIVDGLDDERFNRQPGPGEWSVCECLDHLIIVGDKLTEAIDAALEKAHRDGKYGRGPFRYGPLERWFVRTASRINPTGRARVQTFDLYQPNRDQSATNVLAAYRTLQDNLVERVEAASGLHLARIRITSPATRWVRMSLGQWLHMIPGHQERHIDQARRARERVETSQTP